MSTRDDQPTFGGGNASVEIFMAEQVASVPADASVRQAAQALLEAAVGALVVGTPEQIDGVLSERDILRVVADGIDLDATKASEIDTHTVVWCDRSATVAEVTEVMMEKYVRHVLVEEDGRLVGIVSARDLLGAYAT